MAVKRPGLLADTRAMAQTPKLFYHVMVERFRGPTPNEIDETVDCENFDFTDPERACAEAQAAVAAAATPVLLPDGVELTHAEVEAFYYLGEYAAPLPPMSLDAYDALVYAGRAERMWSDEWPARHFQQDLPPEVAAVLAERARVAYEEWLAACEPSRDQPAGTS